MEKKREKKRIKVTSQIRQLSFDLKSAKKKPDEPGASVRLALFLGAGASFQSQIPVASGMIRHFKDEIYKRYGRNSYTDEENEKWLEEQEWYKERKSDYCCLFEKCYENESKRRSYIESIIERKLPSVGYIVLANLIKYGYLKTVITTNFDSLVSLACSNYTDIFPVVYSLGNYASELIVSSERPSILKLHGDFLFSRLKNTSEDLEIPDENMEHQMIKILEEYDGLIIVGYSGADESVMSILKKIPGGKKTIYWCGLSEDSLSADVKNFLDEKKATFVKIEGFDELMQAVRILVELTNENITDTFQKRQLEINNKLSEFENILLIDEETNKIIRDTETERFKRVLEKSREVTQLLISANQAFNESNLQKAEEFYDRAIKLNPGNAEYYYQKGILLFVNESRWDEADKLFNDAISLSPSNAVVINCLGFLRYIQKRYDEAINLFEQSIKKDYKLPFPYINLSAIYKLKFDEEEFIEFDMKSETYYDDAKNFLKPVDYYLWACLHATRRDRENTLKSLRQAILQEPVRKFFAQISPTFKWLINDADFLELVGDKNAIKNNKE